MIVSASRRTDIPAFYADWMMARLRAGRCDARNPRNPRVLSRVDLSPEGVRCIVFWTRNFAPLTPHIPEIERMGHRFYVQVTLTGLPGVFEPHVPPPENAVRTFRELADRIGPDRVVWRYDPILLTGRTPPEWHIATFRRLSSALSGATRRCVLSLYDPYAAAARRLRALGPDCEPHVARCGDDSPPLFPGEVPEGVDIRPMLRSLRESAGEAGMELRSCAEPLICADSGIFPGACVDAGLIGRLTGGASLPPFAAKDPGQRPACRCAPSRDIGEYDTCLFGCAYCYATRSLRSARERWKRSAPSCASLIPRSDGSEPVAGRDEGGGCS
jgi:hypothetical protein